MMARLSRIRHRANRHGHLSIFFFSFSRGACLAHSLYFHNEFFTPGWSFTSSGDKKDDINITETFTDIRCEVPSQEEI
jgi:hypothetical protein